MLDNILGIEPTVDDYVALEKTTLGTYTHIQAHSVFCDVTVGDYSYFAGYNQVYYANIGKFCSVASFARINTTNHPTYDRIAQHHFTYRSRRFGFGEDDAEFFAQRKNKSVTIGNDVWIGHNAIILPGVSIGKFCPKKAIPSIRQMINLLAGIPSVIYGLFGMITIVPFLRDTLSPNGVGYGILAASLVLSVMILPTIVSVSLDALNAVPKNYHEGALALGATEAQSVFKVVLPAAKSGIYAAVVLSIGRAIGETMAVIMVIGGSPVMPNSLFQSVRTLTANIAMGATELRGDAATALVSTGVVLFFFTLLLNISFSLLKGDARLEKKRAQKTDS